MEKITALCYGPVGLEHECVVRPDTDFVNVEVSSPEIRLGIVTDANGAIMDIREIVGAGTRTYRFIGPVEGKAIYVRADR